MAQAAGSAIYSRIRNPTRPPRKRRSRVPEGNRDPFGAMHTEAQDAFDIAVAREGGIDGLVTKCLAAAETKC